MRPILKIIARLKEHIPNFLSLLRIPLAFLCIYSIFPFNPKSLTISLILFMLASGTDFLDGYLARRWKKESNFGKIIDPIADKVLILGALFVFSWHGIVPLVLTIIIAIREILLTVIRLMLLSKKVVLASIQSGKIKTFSQVGVLLFIYVVLIFKLQLVKFISLNFIHNIVLLLILWIVFITLYSGYEFFIRNKKAISKLSV